MVVMMMVMMMMIIIIILMLMTYIYIRIYTSRHVTSRHVNRICRGCAPGFAAAADEAVFARQSLVTQLMEGGVVEEWAETMIDSSVVGLSTSSW